MPSSTEHVDAWWQLSPRRVFCVYLKQRRTFFVRFVGIGQKQSKLLCLVADQPAITD
jgi:hypothetical protein